MKDYKLYIDGKFVDSQSGETYKAVNPATEEPIAEVAKANREDTKRAIAAARKAFDEGPWPRTSARERARIMLQIAKKLAAQGTDLASIESQDSGGTIRKTMGDVALSGMQLQAFADQGSKFPYVEQLPLQELPGLSQNFVLREPYGVCSQIIPWNFPLMMAIWKIGPALATGNTVVLKPASITPCSALELAKIIDETDLPKGVVNVISGPGSECGEEMCTSPMVDKVAFTGSTVVGRRIMQLASGTVKKVTLELGGKSPTIILDDADLDMATDGSLFGCMFHQGQVCESGTRLFVSEALHDAFVERLVNRTKTLRIGDPSQFDTDLGPMVSEQQRQVVEDYVESGQKEGAKIVVGGGRPAHMTKGYYLEPTIFIDVKNEMKIAQEEIFGPVLCVIRYKNLDDAVRMANDSIYGLAGAVWSRDKKAALAVAKRIRTGTVWINDHHLLSPTAPFGGYKQSGIGREFGSYGLSEYLQIKHIHVDNVDDLQKKFWYQTLFGRGA
ncbi:MAG: aldehyde dehydrogenase [Deltaproteobacteria bacterium RBG_13_65_10]|nr:MAG: aldehyde dehydrogenase [Deltaproteobacteria bacterium RBG_13_65_10]